MSAKQSLLLHWSVGVPGVEGHCCDTCLTLHGPINFFRFGRFSPRPTILSDERVQHWPCFIGITWYKYTGHWTFTWSFYSQKCSGEHWVYHVWHKHLYHLPTLWTGELVLILSLPTCKIQRTLPISLGKTKGHSEKMLLGRLCQRSSFCQKQLGNSKVLDNSGKTKCSSEGQLPKNPF